MSNQKDGDQGDSTALTVPDERRMISDDLRADTIGFLNSLIEMNLQESRDENNQYRPLYMLVGGNFFGAILGILVGGFCGLNVGACLFLGLAVLSYVPIFKELLFADRDPNPFLTSDGPEILNEDVDPILDRDVVIVSSDSAKSDSRIRSLCCITRCYKTVCRLEQSLEDLEGGRDELKAAGKNVVRMDELIARGDQLVNVMNGVMVVFEESLTATRLGQAQDRDLRLEDMRSVAESIQVSIASVTKEAGAMNKRSTELIRDNRFDM